MHARNAEASVFQISMELNVLAATTTVRFPCLFWLQWKTNDQKINLQTSRHSREEFKTQFNQNLLMKIQMVYDRSKRLFAKKQTLIQLNLVSKNRPDQTKLVGRITVDLANVLNNQFYSLPTEFPLQFCSVNASVLLSFRVVEKVQTDVSVSEVQKSCGDVNELNNSNRVSGISGIKDKSRDSSQFSHDLTPISNKRADTLSSNRRPSVQIIQISSGKQTLISFREQASQKDNASTKDTKQQIIQQKVTSQIRTVNQYKSLGRQKPEIVLPVKQNDILGQIKISPIGKEQQAITSFKTIALSVQNEQSRASEHKLAEESSRYKVEVQRLKLQTEKAHHEQQKYRFQIERQKKEVELVKLQARQKQGLLDKATHQTNSLRGQITRLREEAVNTKQQISSANLKILQFKDSNNRLTLQLNSAQKMIKQLSGVRKLVEEGQGVKSELNLRVRQLEIHLEDYQSKCVAFQKQKYELEGTLLRFNQDAEAKEQSYCSQVDSLQAETQFLREQINRQLTILNEQSNQINGLVQQGDGFKQQIGNLESRVVQYSQQKQAWLIERDTFENDSKQTSERIKELEETLMLLQEKIGELQGQNTKWVQNCRQKDQEIEQRIIEQASEAGRYNEQIRRQEQETNRYKLLLDQQIGAKQSTQAKNYTLQEDLLTLNERFTGLGLQYQKLVSEHSNLTNQYSILTSQHISLKGEHQNLRKQRQELGIVHQTLTNEHQNLISLYQNLTNQNNSQIEKNTNLQSVHLQLNERYNQLEQVLITTNEERTRETDDANLRERGLNQQITQLSEEVTQTKYYVSVGEERMGILERQLIDRQHMIGRLQESLTHQIQRNEELNNQLGGYYQREERFKFTITVLETEFRRIEQLLVEQEMKQSLNIQLLRQHETKIVELNVLLSSKTQSYLSLEAVIDQTGRDTANEVAGLNAVINQKTNRIVELEGNITQKDETIRRIDQKYAQAVAMYQQRIIQEQQSIDNLKNQITVLEDVKNNKEIAIKECEDQIAKLQSDYLTRQSELTIQVTTTEERLAQAQKNCNQLKQSDEYNKLLATEMQANLDELTIKQSELQSELSLKEELSKQDALRYSSQISELKQNYQILQNDKQLFNITNHKRQLKEKVSEVVKLEGQLQLARIQIAKIVNLERALKIKTIELNSLKFRSKNDNNQNKSQLSELIKLKDEQIASLNTQRSRLIVLQTEFIALKQQMSSLTQELQVLQEEKFNIESRGNEIALTLEETKQQNIRLVEEIAIMSERNGELHQTIQENYPKEGGAGQKSLFKQNLALKKQLRQVEVLKNKVISLQQDRRKLQNQVQTQKAQKTTNVIQQQAKNSKALSKPNNAQKKSSGEDQRNIVLLNNTYKSLKELITTRVKGKSEQKLIELLGTFLNNQTKKSVSLQEKSKVLSKQFQKLKVSALKRRDNKEEERSQLMELFKYCENIINQFLAFA